METKECAGLCTEQGMADAHARVHYGLRRLRCVLETADAVA
jgi:hypothetical protein